MPRRRRRLTEKRKPRRQPTSQEGGWWTIKQIVNERSVKGKVEYLVDWEDNRETSESYPLSWIKASDVLDDAIEEWEDKKQSAQTQEAPSQAERETTQASDDSQPPRPANYRTLRRSNTTVQRTRQHTDDGDGEGDDDIAPYKRPRVETTSPSSEPVPSITSSVSIESTTFEEPPIQRPPQYFVVELKNEPEFDLSEYLSVRGSQSTAAHSQLLSELESQDQRIAVASRHSQGTIPDSQDPSSPGDLDSQRRETQQSLYPSPVVIPDSQDLGRDKSSPDKSSPAKSSLDKTFTRPRTPASGSRDKCTSSHKQVIADSAAVESDIPSHQPDQYHSVESPDLSAEKTDNQGARQDSKSQTFSEASQQAADQSEPKPVFFSQAKFNVAPEVPLSPQGIHTQGKYEASISQDTRPSYQSATGFFRRASEAWDRGKNPPQLEMFAEQGDESKSSERQRQVSAVNQLRSLWDVAPTDGPAPNSEGHSSAAAELAALSASDAQDDRHDPQRTSPAAYFTQPPQQDTPDDQAVGGDPMSSEPATGRQRSAVDSLRDLVNQTFSTPDGPSPEALMPPPSFTMQQGTVSPRDVSKPVEAEKTTLALLPSLSEGMSENFGSSGNSITMGQVAPTHDESSESSDEEPTQADHVITLPFQASIRDLYYETLLKYKEDVVKFGAVFADEIYEPPDESLVKTINELFNRLQNLCNYPEDIVGTSIQTLPSNKKVKYSLDANAKFNFLFELLQGIQKDTAVLIVAGSTNLLRPLVELVESLKLDCTCDAIGHAAKDAFRLSAVRVTLCLPDTVDPSRFDVIVGYDSAFNHSAMSTDLAANGSGTPARNQPLVLRLTAAFSIEQIDLEMPNTSDELERMDALLVGVTAARRLIRNPPQMHEPHEIAKLFVDYVNGETDSLLWEPDQLPDDVLDVYFNSQSMSQRPQATPSDAENGRKRKLDEEDDTETKRMRRVSRAGPVSQMTAPPLTEAVRALLNKAGFKDAPSTEAQLSVPLLILETLAAKMAEAERVAAANDLEVEYKKVIDQLDTRVKEHESSTEQIYEKYRSALGDRTQFDAQARKAEAALQAKTEEMQRGEEKSAAKIAELESRIARLTDDSATGSSLGATDKLLQEATEKIRVLEKQLQNARGEKDYVMEQYQLANSSTSVMRAEINQLKAQNAELDKKASDNLLHIHEMNNKNTVRELTRKIAELETRLKEREIELDRVRDELRQVKNGRRETRQVSVPRSPRMGIMSPRAPPRAGVSGSASRGASPSPAISGPDAFGTSGGPGVPVVQFTNAQAGNGRWNPLR